LPEAKLQQLRDEGFSLWEEYGRGQVVFAYIDLLQQAAERGFDPMQDGDGALQVAQEMKISLMDFDEKVKREKFEQETFECGVCLEPKKGSSCYRLLRCGHVFCVPCLQDFYNNCIAEGDVASVKCLDPTCGKEKASARGGATKRKRKFERTLNPSELLQIPLEKAVVQRYVELKRKKKLESDKSTIYCPRKWCQGAARSKKYPKLTDLSQIADFDSSDSEAEGDPSKDTPQTNTNSNNNIPPPSDRLAICEDCNYAFCRICQGGWHGEFVRCWPRSASDLTVEEQASYDYIRLHTSPCPTCSSPCQKTHGCNHMNCFQCHTHFCYLCGAWLDSGNPYQHFNRKEIGCYMRLWELEEGDDGEAQVRFEGARGWEAAIRAADEADAAAGGAAINGAVDGPANDARNHAVRNAAAHAPAPAPAPAICTKIHFTTGATLKNRALLPIDNITVFTIQGNDSIGISHRQLPLGLRPAVNLRCDDGVVHRAQPGEPGDAYGRTHQPRLACRWCCRDGFGHLVHAFHRHACLHPADTARL